MTDDPFTLHRSLLFTAAYEILGSAADAEDTVQETWLRLPRPQFATITSAVNVGLRSTDSRNAEPSSNHERGAGAPQSVCRRGSRSDQRIGSWSGSMI